MSLRVWIVDDEPLARERIRTLLNEDPSIEIAGESRSGSEALAAILDHAPDLVFLDVQMPELDGFGVLAALPPDRLPAVIFVTAFDQHALRAFEVHAIDYLLKPFAQDRFFDALTRAKALVGHVASHASPPASRAQLLALLREVHAESAQRIAVHVDGKILLLRQDELDWIEADGNYVKLHTGRKEHLHREPLKEFEARLDPARFLRIHRSIVVNLDRVRELQPWFHGGYVVVLEDGTELHSSRGHGERLRELFGKGK